MDNRISTSAIARMVAERRGMSGERAETMVREFFRTIEEGLKTDSIVKVKNLGTFKLVKVEARESVNISTGQRFTIDGHTKITFTPDTYLRETINKPFAEFETIVLNEGVNVEQLESIGADNDEEAVAEETVAMESDNVTEPMPVMAEEEVATKEAQCQEEIVVEANETEEATETEITQEATEEAESSSTTETEENTADKVQIAPIAMTVSSNTETEQKKEKEMGHNAKFTLCETLALMLFVIVMMGISYLAGYYRWLTPDIAPATPAKEKVEQVVKSETAMPPTQTTDTVAVQPAKQETQKVEPQTQAEVYPQLEGGEYKITGVLDEHKIKVGESLRTLSIKYYGTKDMVPYIVLFNDIQNPDVVSLGKNLKLPKLEKR
ncbi:MAG: HU family DNA-binding protein [Bacteroidaceae bacterium]|nr:HU family DNA-binding protein [Bacteroidaceae bacterium]